MWSPVQIYIHNAIPSPSSLQSSTLAALEDAVARCPSLTPQSVSQGVGIGYMIGFECCMAKKQPDLISGW